MINEEKINSIRQGYYSAFIDGSTTSSLAFKPEFVSNNYREGKKVISTVEAELLHCEEFCISVAFITMGGITPLLQTFKELEDRGISGKILTTNYLNFSQPEALEKLHALSNIELRMYMSAEDEGFHTKGYIFRDQDLYRIIVGSSNLTLSALTKNKEWNTRVISTENGEFADSVLGEFHDLWNSEQTQKYDDFIGTYRTAYLATRKQREVAGSMHESNTISYELYTLKPNTMQTAFIANVEKIRDEGKHRALLISATGTGKTYASAFALREINAKKVLFLVHREQIAKQAINSYKKVFGNTKTFGLLSGNSKVINADYLFATMQMMSKEESLRMFRPDEFETIIIDEVHKAGAKSYQRIMEYFRPAFWLGMTATPERTDGYDIYQLFDHNIAYEIRLQQAMEENLLCPFHYFGITDLEIDGEIADDSQNAINDLKKFNYLTSDERVKYILEKASYYGHSGSRVKGLIFVSRREVGLELSRKFNEAGLRTVFLSGDTSQQLREEYIERLSMDEPFADCLDYIFTVDIFNEGVDIPEVNQVIMLRPTQSPIIFVQQLGRGLRKAANKEYVVILDFIGNYANNYMIPIALSGDRSYNKDNMRRCVADGARVIPGSSSIHFDEISRKRIYASIDSANVNDIKLIKESYIQLKYKLGRIPELSDFDKYGEMDALHIIEKCGSYYNFLIKYDKDYKTRVSDREAKILEFISSKFANGKRIHELLAIKLTIRDRKNVISALSKEAQSMEVGCTEGIKQSVINILTNEFPAGTGKKTYQDCILINRNAQGDYDASTDFVKMLADSDFVELIEETVEFGVSRYNRDYCQRYRDTNLVLYQKYTYEDACRLLNWAHNEVPLNIGGYKYDSLTKTFPVFVNYVKDESVVATQQYEDHFISPDRLVAISKSGRTLLSEDVQNFLRCQERGIHVHLFVRKNKDDKISKEFYYLGEMVPTGWTEAFVLPGTDKNAVKIGWKLDVPVREDLYEYITEEEDI